MRRLLIKNWSMFLTITVSLFGIGLSRLGFLPSVDAIQITFFLLCLFSVNQVIFNGELFSRLESMAETRRVSEAINVEEFYSRLEYEVLKATETIDLTVHTSTNPTIAAGRFQKDYFSAIDSVIKKRRVMVRRIVTINSFEKLESVEDWIARYRDCLNLSIRYSEIPDYGIPAPFSVQVIDGRVAFLAGLSTGGHVSAGRNVDAYIKDDELTGALQEYYNQYWASLPSLKEGNKINDGLFADIRQRLRVASKADI